MKIQMQKPLFAWDCLEDHPILATIKQLLETVPDSKLLEGSKPPAGRGVMITPFKFCGAWWC